MMRHLRKRARAAGVPVEERDEAINADYPKDAIIDLIVGYELYRDEQHVRELRSTLSIMPKGLLKKRSREAGVPKLDYKRAEATHSLL